MQHVALLELDDGQREQVLIEVDALAEGSASLVDDVTVEGVFARLAGGQARLFNDDAEVHVGIGAVDAHADLWPVSACCGHGVCAERDGVVALPAGGGNAVVLAEHRALLARYAQRGHDYQPQE